MKKTGLVLTLIVFSIFSLSCSSYRYPLGKTTKKAFKHNLKRQSKSYRYFIPVSLPPDSLQADQWTAPSPNFNKRKPDLVIVHYTAQKDCETSLKTLSQANTTRKVSAHYLVCKDGTVYNMVDENYRAWQAGLSRWGNTRDVNSSSIGIELDNNGEEEFPESQIHSLLVLLKSIDSRYNISQGNFIGHADVAPTRRKDPGRYFPWDELAEEGFGYQTDSILPEVPENFGTKAALRLIGYDIRDLEAAKIAFKRHFVQTEKDPEPDLNSEEKQILYSIYLKYLKE